MLDTEATDRRRGPGRHRRPLARQRRAAVMTLVRSMNAWLAGKVKRER
jgi:hypothetical protein